MIIIRNPYVQVLGGIFWDIKATYEAPTQEGRPGDIRLVLPYPKGQPTLQDYLNPYLDTIRTVTNDRRTRGSKLVTYYKVRTTRIASTGGTDLNST